VRPDQNARKPSLAIDFLAQSITFLYGSVPSARVFYFIILVLMLSKGRATTVAAHPATTELDALMVNSLESGVNFLIVSFTVS
jgi:hypothetical protein